MIMIQNSKERGGGGGGGLCIYTCVLAQVVMKRLEIIWRSERACASAATIRSSKWKSAMDIWYVRFYLEAIGGACRVEGRGFEPRCGTFFSPLPHFFSSFPFFFSPGFLFFFSFPLSPSSSLRHFNAQAFF